jgi:phosphatidylinositol-3-phosphatase
MALFKSALGVLSAFFFAANAQAGEVSRYDHIFVIIAENKNFEHIVGSANAPRLSALAKEYGLATKSYGVVHPSQANYIAMLGGDTFGIHDDDAWFCTAQMVSPDCEFASNSGYATHVVQARSLMDQLTQANLTWKGYFEDLPEPGSLAIFNPSRESPEPDRARFLYAAKHNAFITFEKTRDDPKLAEKIVPLEQLRADLASGALPNFAHIVLNQCNDMHGLFPADPMPPEGCVLDFKKRETVEALIRRGDKAIGDVVDEIVASPAWSSDKNIAIVVTFDEDSTNSAGQQGCCGYDPNSPANFGGGRIATIVATNHGPRQIEDATPYNHYSLLRTVEEAFGITEHLGFAAADDKGVKSMTPLFAVPEKPVTPVVQEKSGSPVAQKPETAGAEDTAVTK